MFIVPTVSTFFVLAGLLLFWRAAHPNLVKMGLVMFGAGVVGWCVLNQHHIFAMGH